MTIGQWNRSRLFVMWFGVFAVGLITWWVCSGTWFSVDNPFLDNKQSFRTHLRVPALLVFCTTVVGAFAISWIWTGKRSLGEPFPGVHLSALRYRRFLWIGLAIVAVALFAASVWPTRYRDGVMMSNSRPARIDRFTGRAEMLAPIGWVPVSASAVILR
jgi:hypothetical protein